MPAATYSKPPRVISIANEPISKAQAKSSPKGKLHTDFNALYKASGPNVDLFKQSLRITARLPGEDLDLSALVEQLQWTDDSASGGSGSGVISYMNTQVPLTGSVQLRKPSLNQYNKLVLPALSAAQSRAQHGQSRFGAAGLVIICSVGYGRSFVPVWAMRVQPTSGTSAEEVDLQDGTWTLNLTDDLQMLNMSSDDFKFSKGKKTHTKGWRCHEIAAAVGQQYAVPIKQLARGTAFIDLSSTDTTNVPPMSVIQAAYDQEMYKTGRAFVIRWAAPDRKYPLGALEVVPMRRNPNLLRFREQLTNAILTRSQSPGFATSILGRATLKHPHGKHKKLTYHYINETAVRRFGFIHHVVDFNPVDNALELQILTKRAMAFRLTPLRTAELTHPGIATIRRGDGIRVDIPEEGYAQIALDAYGQPATPKSKQSALALKAAELADPSLFGIVDVSALDPTSAAGLDLSTQATADVAALVPIADQSLAFVTSVTHTASAQSYSMDLQTSFVDTLDPETLKAEIEANIRAGKALAKVSKSAASSSSSGSGSGSGVGARWKVPVGWENDSPLGGACSGGPCRFTSNVPGDGMCFSVMSLSGTSGDSGTAGQALTPGSVWPAGAKLYVTNPANGKTVLLIPCDIGAGSSFTPVIGVYGTLGSGSMGALGLTGGPPWELIIQAAPGAPTLRPARGTKV